MICRDMINGVSRKVKSNKKRYFALLCGVLLIGLDRYLKPEER